MRHPVGVTTPHAPLTKRPSPFGKKQKVLSLAQVSSRLATKKGAPWGEWPAASPDLSPIENLWGIMDEELKALGGEKGFATREQFKRAIVKVWKSKTTKSTIKKLIDSVPKRMQEMIDADGGHTSY